MRFKTGYHLCKLKIYTWKTTHFAKTQKYKYQIIYNAVYGWEGE